MKFESIVLFMRPGDISEVAQWIHDDIVDNVADLLDIPVYYHLEHTDTVVLHETSLFIAIGGDGTMLRAMDVSIKSNGNIKTHTSVIGFNAGNLGFLTEDPNYVLPSAAVKSIYDGSSAFWCVDRLALSVWIDSEPHYAINEFTFVAGNISSPVDYTIEINDRLVSEHIGSGCMVATPTGSTAMSMSAGGAIIAPDAAVMQIVPIIPHTLTSRPIITSEFDRITIRSDMDRVNEIVISSDGRKVHTFDSDAVLHVTKSPQPANVWYRKNRDFFQILSTKLNW